MRKQNSLFETEYISERGADARNRTYFAYVPLNGYVCYAIAERYDDDEETRSEELAVKSVLSIFQNQPSMRRSKIKKYIEYANGQLKINSTKHRLEASILVVVSNYASLRYASCGNAKLLILNENQVLHKSVTQTHYQTLLESYNGEYDDAPDIIEANNLTQYLGKPGNLDLAVSKKIKLKENSSLVLATRGLWDKVSTPEILDAYEDKESKTCAEFLRNVEELLLSGQEFEKIPSYSVVSTAVSRVYKEDSARKKKIRKILIIVGIVLLALLIIFLIALGIMRRNDRLLLNEIIEIDREGVRYSVFGNYTKSLERYRAASELAGRLNMRNWQYINEKREVSRRVRQRLELFVAVEEGNRFIEQKNYANAHRIYTYIQIEADMDPELGLSEMSGETLRRLNNYIEAADLIIIGEIYEFAGLYANAVLNYHRALNLLNLNRDHEARRDLLFKIFEAEKKMSDRERAQIDQFISELASEEARARQAFQDEQMRIIQELTLEAVRAERAGDNPLAIEHYTQILDIYINRLFVADERVEAVYRKIAELEASEEERARLALEDEEERARQAQEAAEAAAQQVLTDDIQTFTVNALEAERSGNYDLAIRYYERILDIYINRLFVVDERVERIYQRISELERAILEEELAAEEERRSAERERAEQDDEYASAS